MEIVSRELEGRLLLGLVAAERGHDVLLGDLADLLSHRHWLPPGLFHDTTLTPAPYRLTHHAQLERAGFAVTSQDEEHGLTETDLSGFVAKRYSTATLARADAAFAWGPTDGEAVVRAHPEAAERIVITGSPRADLWRPDMAGFYRDLPLPGVAEGREFVLIATNLAPAATNRFWVQMRDLRPVAFDGAEDPAEFTIYERAGREHVQAGRLVRAIRRLAARRPELLIVVRPHPMEADGAWDDLLGPLDNVLVTREEGIGRWIRRASALVHVRSTSAYEAAVAGVPVIAFRADGDPTEHPVDHLGAQAHDEDELVTLIERALTPTERDAWERASAPVIERLLAATDGPLAAERIVDVWDTLATGSTSRSFRPRSSLALATAHHAIGAARVRTRDRSRAGGPTVPKGGRFETAHKFPPLTTGIVRPIVDAHRRALGRFADVDVRIIGPRLLHLRRS